MLLLVMSILVAQRLQILLSITLFFLVNAKIKVYVIIL